MLLPLLLRFLRVLGWKGGRERVINGTFLTQNLGNLPFSAPRSHLPIKGSHKCHWRLDKQHRTSSYLFLSCSEAFFLCPVSWLWMIFSSTFLSVLDSDLPYFSGSDTSCIGPKEFQSFGGKPWAAILTRPSPTPTGRSGGRGEASWTGLSEEESWTSLICWSLMIFALTSGFIQDNCPRPMVNQLAGPGTVEARLVVFRVSLAASLSALQGGHSIESSTLFPYFCLLSLLLLLTPLSITYYRVYPFKFRLRSRGERGRVGRPTSTLSLSCPSTFY